MAATTSLHEGIEVPGASIDIERSEGGQRIERVTLTYGERTLVAEHDWLQPYENPHYYQASTGDQDPHSRWLQVIGREDLGDGAWGPWERITLRLTPSVAILLEREITGEHPGALGVGAGVLPLRQGPTDPQDPKALVEALAAEEHTRWGDWQRYMQEERCQQAQTDIYMAPQPGELIIGREDAERWARLIATPYADLPEHSKESDREQVKRYWPIWVNYVTDWLIENGLDDAAQDWQEEMAWPTS